MEDRTLLLLAVFTSVIGITVLWFACAANEPVVVALEEVTDELMGKVVTLNGTLGSVKVYDTVVVASFVGSEVTLFGFKSNIPKLEKNDFVTVTGEIKEYKGELEIVPNKLEDVLIVKTAPAALDVEEAEPNIVVTESKDIQHTPNPLINPEPIIIELNKVTYHLVGETITVQGVLKKVKVLDSVVIGEFRGSDLKLFGFKSNIPTLKDWDFVTVTGEIKEYKGELEIVPSKVGDVLIGSGKARV